ncbi:hypothetical protein P8452_60861 [Trifolium repens]|jgi:hypothetical protein|nr:hypothetical protein P8452_60861 [Trifolium repens]
MFLGGEREEGKGVKREVPEKREGEGIALNWRELAVVGDEQRKWIDRIEYKREKETRERKKGDFDFDQKLKIRSFFGLGWVMAYGLYLRASVNFDFRIAICTT